MKQEFKDVVSVFASELISPLSESLSKKNFIKAKDDSEYQTRIEIYRWDIRRRFKSCIMEDFPLLLELAGSEKFEIWAEDYFIKFPSNSFSLSDYTENFANLLRERKEDTFWCDLADWEWNDCLLIWDSLDWKSVPFEGGNLKINTTLKFIKSEFPLLEIENQHKILEKTDLENYYVQYRKSDGLHSLKLENWQFEILKKMYQSISLDESLSQVAENFNEELDDQAISSAFSSWVANEILSLESLS
jgi:hypothetical protein